MSKWSQMYADKLTTPAEAMKDINLLGQSVGQRRLLHSGGIYGRPLRPGSRAPGREIRELHHAGAHRQGDAAGVAAEHSHRGPSTATPLDRGFLAAGLITHSPYNFHQLSRTANSDAGYHKLLIQTGPMDENGYLNQGTFANFLDVIERG